MLHLYLHIFRYPIAPEPRPEFARRLAFQKLNVAIADDFTIHDEASAVADAISGADRLYTSVMAARGFLFPFGLCEVGSEL